MMIERKRNSLMTSNMDGLHKDNEPLAIEEIKIEPVLEVEISHESDGIYDGLTPQKFQEEHEMTLNLKAVPNVNDKIKIEPRNVLEQSQMKFENSSTAADFMNKQENIVFETIIKCEPQDTNGAFLHDSMEKKPKVEASALEEENEEYTDHKLHSTNCKKSFSCKYRLKDHMNIHTGNRPFTCEVCSKSFSRKCYLDVHVRNHFLSCEICNEAFARRELLISHMRQHSDVDIRPFTCEICNKLFIRKYNLTCHKRIHDDRPYHCGICNKCFPIKISLTMHMRTHTGNHPYACGICCKSFAQNYSLTCHLRTHTGISPYICEVCNKSFTRNSTLKFHMQNHSGNRSYVCSVCNKTFAWKQALRRHAKGHNVNDK